MTNSTNIIDLVDDKTITTKTPFNYYITVFSLSGFFILFSVLAISGQIDIESAVIGFFFFGAIIYANFGRYLAKVHLFKNRIEVSYLFPWNTSLRFEYVKLSEINHKERPWLTRYDRWYRCYQWLQLKDNYGNVVQLPYNINTIDDEKLLSELYNQLI